MRPSPQSIFRGCRFFLKFCCPLLRSRFSLLPSFLPHFRKVTLLRFLATFLNLSPKLILSFRGE
jgi:hypothetical protein